MFKERIKRIGTVYENYKTLHFNKVPFKDFFISIRRIKDLLKCNETKEVDELFLTVETEKGNKYFYVKMKPEFKEWVSKNFFTGCSGLEIIQQRTSSKTLKEKYIDKYLFLANESQIIGSVWFDYKNGKEVKAFFKV